MIMTVLTLDEFCKRIKKLSAREVGIVAIYKTLPMKTGSFIHVGLVELSAVGGYEVHYVSKVSVDVVGEAGIPKKLEADVDTAITEVKDFIRGEIGSGVITFIDGIFGRSQAEAIFREHILPLQGLESALEEKSAGEKTEPDNNEQKEGEGAKATSS